MRTTLTLDPDVERLIEQEIHRVRRPFKQIVNDAIRRGLAPRLADTPDKPYRVKVHDGRLQPGHDPLSLNRVADELDADAFVDKQRRTKRK